MSRIHLAIIEDNDTIRESLNMFMQEHKGIQVDLTCRSVEEFLSELEGIHQSKINTLILDIGLPGMTGVQGIFHIKKALPGVDIIMLTTYEEGEVIFEALCAGACSYISKRTPLSKIREAVVTVHRGGSYMSPMIARKIATHFQPKINNGQSNLTDRQLQIINAIVDGLSYKMVADKLGISLDTVRDHIKKIYRQLEINSKAELIRMYSK